VKALRFPRQGQVVAGLLPGGLHGWLNQGTYWHTRLVLLNLKTRRPRCSGSARIIPRLKPSSPKQTEARLPASERFARRETIAKYGVLWPDRGYANRATFVVDTEGRSCTSRRVAAPWIRRVRKPLVAGWPTRSRGRGPGPGARGQGARGAGVYCLAIPKKSGSRNHLGLLLQFLHGLLCLLGAHAALQLRAALRRSSWTLSPRP